MKLISKYSSNKGFDELPKETTAPDDEVLVVDDTSTGMMDRPSNQGDSLVDQTNRIKQIWRKICLQSCRNIRAQDIELVSELPINVIRLWLVNNRIAADVEKSQHIIDTYVGKSLNEEECINIHEFTRLFQKGMFRQALLKLAQTFEWQVSKGLISDQLSLTSKLTAY